MEGTLFCAVTQLKELPTRKGYPLSDGYISAHTLLINKSGVYVEISTVIFIAAIIIFLLVIAFSAIRIHVMTELDEMDDFEGSAGIAQTSSYTVDGEQ
jgi:hypothetical protein